MGQGKLMRDMASKVPSTKGGSVEAKGSPGIKMSPILGGMGKGLFRGAVAGKQEGYSGEEQPKRTKRGMFGSLGRAGTMRMAGASFSQKKEECD